MLVDQVEPERAGQEVERVVTVAQLGDLFTWERKGGGGRRFRSRSWDELTRRTAAELMEERAGRMRAGSMTRTAATTTTSTTTTSSVSPSSSRPHLRVGGSPETLDTVLENMPLVYNRTTKRLEYAEGAADLEAQKRRSFKKTHIRRGSYESAQIKLLPPGTPPALILKGIEFQNEATRCSTRSMASSGFHSDSSRPSCSDKDKLGRAVEGEQGAEEEEEEETTADDSITNPSSKTSSLDRRSQDSAAALAADELLPTTTKTKKPLTLPNISLPKGLFTRKSNSEKTAWKLFGARQQQHHQQQGNNGGGVVSTSGLILEDRPANLPAKSAAESARHKQLYAEMLDAAKKKEEKEAKLRKKAQEQQKKAEDQMSTSCRFWREEILPKWNEMYALLLNSFDLGKNSKRCRELWWEGLPPKVRGQVWSLAIGNDLNLTRDLYEKCCSRAKERLAMPSSDPNAVPSLGPKFETDPNSGSDTDGRRNRESTVELVRLDVSRTFPQLGIFQPDGPYHELLTQLLGAYVCHRTDVGYVQSMSFVAGVLLLNLEPFEAFVAFSNLLSHPLQRALFQLLQPDMTNYFIAYDHFFEQQLPQLHAHFDRLDVRPDLYLIEWLYPLYAKSLPLDVTCRIWDVYLRDGEDFLFATALGILHILESELLCMDFDQCVQQLAHLPPIDADLLFDAVQLFLSENCAKNKRPFSAILREISDRLGSVVVSGGSESAAGNKSSPTPSSKQHSRRPSDTSLASVNSQLSAANLKMSKSLSGFLGDLLHNSSQLDGQQQS